VGAWMVLDNSADLWDVYMEWLESQYGDEPASG
jgi:hypothetical protein